jgi:hypothetical protein
VFPSADSLAAAAPDAARQGETDTPPTGSLDCAHSGTDVGRGPGTYSFKIHWLARDNILVGVQYNTSLGADQDPIVAEVRNDLQKLP